MNKIFLIVALGLVGCGGPGLALEGPPDKADMVCVAEGIPFFHTSHRDCSLIQANTVLARQILESHGLVSDFSSKTVNLKIEIKDVDDLSETAGIVVAPGLVLQGYYAYHSGAIVLNRTGKAFLHELLHVLQYQEGGHRNSQEEWHLEWADLGYYEADIEFKLRSESLYVP